jgi:hypothetical protein
VFADEGGGRSRGKGLRREELEVVEGLGLESFEEGGGARSRGKGFRAGLMKIEEVSVVVDVALPSFSRSLLFPFVSPFPSVDPFPPEADPLPNPPFPSFVSPTFFGPVVPSFQPPAPFASDGNIARPNSLLARIIETASPVERASSPRASRSWLMRMRVSSGMRT